MNSSQKAPDSNENKEEPCDSWGDEIQATPEAEPIAAVAPASAAVVMAAPASNLPPPAPALAPIPFPFCNKPDHFPGILARSALFRVERLARGQTTSPAGSYPVKAQGPYQLAADGPLLTMNDKRVFDAVVRQAKATKLDLNEPMRTSLRELATAMGLGSTDGRSLGWIADSLGRLAKVNLTFRLSDGVRREGALLASVQKGPAGVIVRFDPGFALPAFNIDKQFFTDSKRRSSLSIPLSQWFHDYLSSHSEPYDLTLPHLRDLCGHTGRSASFPERLEGAMAALAAAAPGIVKSSKINKPSRSSDLWTLTVERGPESANFFDPVAMRAAVAAKAKDRAGPKGKPTAESEAVAKTPAKAKAPRASKPARKGGVAL